MNVGTRVYNHAKCIRNILINTRLCIYVCIHLITFCTRIYVQIYIYKYKEKYTFVA